MVAVYRVIIYNRNMTQSEDTRRQVEHELGHRLKDETWWLLEELGYVADCEPDDTESIEDLVGLARICERSIRRSRQEEDGESRSVHVEEPDYQPHIRATILNVPQFFEKPPDSTLEAVS